MVWDSYFSCLFRNGKRPERPHRISHSNFDEWWRWLLLMKLSIDNIRQKEVFSMNTTFLLSMAVVVAQAVERRHSVRAGRVRIPEAPRVRILAFFVSDVVVNLFSLGVGHFFLSIKWDLSIKVTSLFFPISYHQQCLCNIALSIVTQMWKINPKRGREWPIFKKKKIIKKITTNKHTFIYFVSLLRTTYFSLDELKKVLVL